MSVLAWYSAVQNPLPQRIRKEKNKKYFVTVEDVKAWVQKFPKKLCFTELEALNTFVHYY